MAVILAAALHGVVGVIHLRHLVIWIYHNLRETQRRSHKLAEKTQKQSHKLLETLKGIRKLHFVVHLKSLSESLKVIKLCDQPDDVF